jgi:hypothetical protein
MELRYMGFDQSRNLRVYKFGSSAPNTPASRFVVSVDLSLFLKHHIHIQEGPTLCAQKLTADLEAQHEGDHELTNEDLVAYVADRAAAEARKAESRRRGPRRRKPEAGQPVSPWWR